MEPRRHAATPPPAIAPLLLAPCLLVGALPYLEPLVAAAAAAELHLHPAVVASVVLSGAALFYWKILSLNLLVARRQAQEEPQPKPSPAATTAAPTTATSRVGPIWFVVLCLVTGLLPFAEPLVAAAAAGFHLHPAVVVLAVAALFHGAVFSLNLLVARRPAQGEEKLQPRPAAATAAASRLPLLPFVVLVLTIAAAEDAKPALAAAAGTTHLPPKAAVCASLVLAVSFHVAIGSVYCFVVNGPPRAVAGAAARSGSEATAVIFASIASAAVMVMSGLLIAGGAASGSRSASF